MNMSSYAMRLARLMHLQQKRKYTGEPYFVHLAEVAAITSSIFMGQSIQDDAVSVAWLHDSMEDQGVSFEDFAKYGFNENIVHGVAALSDLELGNRATRKSLARERLWSAPTWVQTIKCADLISNLPSIAKHDPNFAVVYVKEVELLIGNDRFVPDPSLLQMLKSDLLNWDTKYSS